MVNQEWKLQQYLKDLIKLNTNMHIMTLMEYKLSLLLDILYNQTYFIATPLQPNQKTLLMAAI
jgi:hypothetical protein